MTSFFGLRGSRHNILADATTSDTCDTQFEGADNTNDTMYQPRTFTAINAEEVRLAQSQHQTMPCCSPSDSQNSDMSSLPDYVDDYEPTIIPGFYDGENLAAHRDPFSQPRFNPVVTEEDLAWFPDYVEEHVSPLYVDGRYNAREGSYHSAAEENAASLHHDDSHDEVRSDSSTSIQSLPSHESDETSGCASSIGKWPSSHKSKPSSAVSDASTTDFENLKTPKLADDDVFGHDDHATDENKEAHIKSMTNAWNWYAKGLYRASNEHKRRERYARKMKLESGPLVPGTHATDANDDIKPSIRPYEKGYMGRKTRSTNARPRRATGKGSPIGRGPRSCSRLMRSTTLTEEAT